MIDTGDTVHHLPTSEDWLVACVDGEDLYWLGWPRGSAKLADCELREKATQEDRLMWLRDLAKPGRDESDARTRIARNKLQMSSNAQANLPPEAEGRREPFPRKR